MNMRRTSFEQERVLQLSPRKRLQDRIREKQGVQLQDLQEALLP